jgi:excisionase family DNA binding protein
MASLTTAQAAELLGVNASRVRQMILAGQLKARKQGRDWLIDERSLRAVTVRTPGRPKRGSKP